MKSRGLVAGICLIGLLALGTASTVEAVPVALNYVGHVETVDLKLVDGKWVDHIWTDPDVGPVTVGNGFQSFTATGTIIIDDSFAEGYEKYINSRTAVHEIISYDIDFTGLFRVTDDDADGVFWGTPDSFLSNQFLRAYLISIGGGVHAYKYLDEGWDNFKYVYSGIMLDYDALLDSGGFENLFSENSDGIRTAVYFTHGATITYREHLTSVPEPSSFFLLLAGAFLLHFSRASNFLVKGRLNQNFCINSYITKNIAVAIAGYGEYHIDCS